MELLPLLSLTLLLVVVVILYSLLTKIFKGQNKLPPGRTGWPIIGESLDFLSCGWKGTPEKFIWERTSRYSSDIFTTCLFGQRMGVASGAAANKFLFTSENKYVRFWWPSSLQKMFLSDTTHVMRIRKLVVGFLRPESLKNHVEAVDVAVKKHIETSWKTKQEVTVYPLVKNFTLLVACKMFASIDDPKQIEEFTKPYEILMAGIMSIPINLPGTPLNRAIKAVKEVRKVLLEVIKQKKVEQHEGARSKNDLIFHLLTTVDDNGRFLNETEIAETTLGLIVAGRDPTCGAITFIIKYLAELPHVYDQVCKEQMEIAKAKQPGELLNWEDLRKMNYSWNVANEVMRLSPPSQISFREALVDFTYNGFSIPKGFKFFWSPLGTHKNPEYFPDPEKFDPTRFERKNFVPYTYVPFGAGPMMCPGNEYARLEILVFMHNLVTKFKWEMLIPNEKIIINPIAKPEKGLSIRLYPH